MAKKSKSNYGMGSFTWREDRQKWKFEKFIGTGFYRKRASVTADSQRKCIELMNEKERNYITQCELLQTSDNNANTVTDVIFKDGITEWLKVFKLNSLKATSYDTFKSTLNNQISKQPIGNMLTKDITAPVLQQYFNLLSATKSITVARKTYNLIQQYMQYFYANEFNKNPMLTVKLPTRKQILNNNPDGTYQKFHEISALSDDEIRILESELTRKCKNGKDYHNYGRALLFILWTFIREGEALALQWKDIDFENKTVHIYKNLERVRVKDKNGDETGEWEYQITTAKTKAGERIIPLNDKALAHITIHKENSNFTNPNDFVFVTRRGNHVHAHYLDTILREMIIPKLGITKVTVHGLRHTGISYFIRHKVDIKIVSKLAGHSSVAMTQEIYYNILKEQEESAIDEINKALKIDF